jgi:RHS repeat-associated protein
MVHSRLTDLTAGATIKVMPREIALPRSPHDEIRFASVEQSGGALLSPILITFVYDGFGCLREQLQWTGSSDLSRSMEGLPRESKARRTRAVNNLTGRGTLQARSPRSLSRGEGGIGGLLARSSGYYGPTGTWSTHDYYHADGNGNITYLVNSAQTLAASYRYDAYGNLLTSSGTLAATNTYRFSSKEFISSAGLYYYLYRFYDPTVQRWLNRDPNKVDTAVNLYVFVGNSPPNGIDPLGLTGWPSTCCELQNAGNLNWAKDLAINLMKRIGRYLGAPDEGHYEIIMNNCRAAKRMLDLWESCQGPLTPAAKAAMDAAMEQVARALVHRERVQPPTLDQTTPGEPIPILLNPLAPIPIRLPTFGPVSAPVELPVPVPVFP